MCSMFNRRLNFQTSPDEVVRTFWKTIGFHRNLKYLYPICILSIRSTIAWTSRAGWRKCGMLVPTQCRSNVQCWLAPCHQSHYLQNGTHVLVWPKLGPELEVCCSHRKLSENRERPPESSNNAHNVQMDDAKLLIMTFTKARSISKLYTSLHSITNMIKHVPKQGNFLNLFIHFHGWVMQGFDGFCKGLISKHYVQYHTISPRYMYICLYKTIVYKTLKVGEITTGQDCIFIHQNWWLVELQ